MKGQKPIRSRNALPQLDAILINRIIMILRRAKNDIYEEAREFHDLNLRKTMRDLSYEVEPLIEKIDHLAPKDGNEGISLMRNKMNNLNQTLMERGVRYGTFKDVANRTNNIFAAMLNGAPQLPSTTLAHRGVLHMIAHRIARLVNCQINHADSWLDIAGYAMLIHNQIAAERQAKRAQSPFNDKAVMDAMEDEITKEIRKE